MSWPLFFVFVLFSADLWFRTLATPYILAYDCIYKCCLAEAALVDALSSLAAPGCMIFIFDWSLQLFSLWSSWLWHKNLLVVFVVPEPSLLGTKKLSKISANIRLRNSIKYCRPFPESLQSTLSKIWIAGWLNALGSWVSFRRFRKLCASSRWLEEFFLSRFVSIISAFEWVSSSASTSSAASFQATTLSFFQVLDFGFILFLFL